MEKLLMKVTMRLPEGDYLETQQIADREHRSILKQVMHFYYRGLDQYRAEQRKTESEAIRGMKPPHRATDSHEEAQMGMQRRRA